MDLGVSAVERIKGGNGGLGKNVGEQQRLLDIWGHQNYLCV